MSRVEQGVSLVRQAIQQDSRRNYTEAARCYREAIVVFKQLLRSRSSSHQLRDLLSEKCIQYENRLRVIERHLLSELDLTKFLKEIETYDCRSSYSTVSSDTKQLYDNPILSKALDEIQLGKRYDAKGDYELAYKNYQSGIDQMLDILKKGMLPEYQSSTVRTKCLVYHDRCAVIKNHLEKGKHITSRKLSHFNIEDSLGSPCQSPIESHASEEDLMEMEEIKSNLSRTNSCQSLDSCHAFHIQSGSCQLRTSSPHYFKCLAKSGKPSFLYSASKQSIHPMDGSFQNLHDFSKSSSQHSLHYMEGNMQPANSRRLLGSSVHSLYPQCVIRRCACTISGESSIADPVVPLANINNEFNLSAASLQSLDEQQEDIVHAGMGKVWDKTMLVEEEEESTAGSIEVEGEDSDLEKNSIELELNQMNLICQDEKYDDAGSDSGISDPSPDAILRDSKSPESLSDRKSPFSDISELKYEKSTSHIVPNVVILSHGSQQMSSAPEVFQRHFKKQSSRFQNPSKDILISQMSQDNIMVLKQDIMDAGHGLVSKSENSDMPIPARRYEYNDPERNKEKNDEVNGGCFFMAAVLDFCWCL